MKTRNIFEVGNNLVVVKIVNADYAKGETPKEPEILATKTFDVDALPIELADGDMIRTLAAYGLSSLMQDRCSSLNDKALAEAGVVTNADAANHRLEGYSDVYAILKDGLFKAARAAGNKAAAVDVFFATGFSNYLHSQGKNVDIATATTLLQGMDADQRKALRSDERIAPCIAQARKDAAQAASEIDLSDLLG